jgi:hypothetical protein
MSSSEEEEQMINWAIWLSILVAIPGAAILFFLFIALYLGV